MGTQRMSTVLVACGLVIASACDGENSSHTRSNIGVATSELGDQIIEQSLSRDYELTGMAADPGDEAQGCGSIAGLDGQGLDELRSELASRSKAAGEGGAPPPEEDGPGCTPTTPRPTVGDLSVLVLLVDYDWDGDGIADCPVDGGHPGDPMNPTCADPSNVTRAQAESATFTNSNSLSNYLADASYGKVTSLSGDVTSRITVTMPTPVPPYWRTGSHAICGIQTEHLEAARAAGYDPDCYDYLIVQQPGMYCGFSGLGGSGTALMNGNYHPLILAHEFGHAMGLPHSNTASCSKCEQPASSYEEIVYRDDGLVKAEITEPITDFSTCYSREYGDGTSAMGSGSYGHFTPPQKRKLGWISEETDDQHTLTAEDTGDYRIFSYEAAIAEAKSLLVPVGSTSYELDLRHSVASEANPFGIPGDWRGLRFRHVEANSDQILDLSPTCDPWLQYGLERCEVDADCHPGQGCGGPPGQRFCRPYAGDSAFWRVNDGALPAATSFIDPDRRVIIANVAESASESTIRVTRLSNAAPEPTQVSPPDGEYLIASDELVATFDDTDGYDCSCSAPACPDPARTVCSDPGSDGKTQSAKLEIWICGEDDTTCSSPIRTFKSSTLRGGDEFSATIGTITSGGTYYWKVRAEDALGLESFSSVRSFIANPRPTVPEPIEPLWVDTNTRVAPDVTFRVRFDNDPTPEATSVTFHVCYDSRCTKPVTPAVTVAATRVDGRLEAEWRHSFEAGRRYYWRARAKDAAEQESGFSQTESFLVEFDSDCETWAGVAPMNHGRKDHSATLLSDGRVLVTGGLFAVPLRSTEMFDPATGNWTDVGLLNIGRNNHAAVLLQDGRVLVTGGVHYDGSDPRWSWSGKSSEIFDPKTSSWTRVADMNAGRERHVATLLPDGRVLVSGGHDREEPVGPIGTAEIYDPTTNTWSTTFDITARADHAVVALAASSELLLVGGTGALRSLERIVLSPFEVRPDAGLPTIFSEHSATLLRNARVLIAGKAARAVRANPGSAETTYDNIERVVGRDKHGATLLPNGNVLLSAGRVGDNYSVESSVYDYRRNQFGPTALLPRTDYRGERGGHVATMLPSGDVLITGGGIGHGASGRTEAALYRYSCGVTREGPDGMASRGGSYSSTVLRGGDVLVMSDDELGRVDLYSTRYRYFREAAPLDTPRRGYTTTLMTNGNVLVAGGLPRTGPGPLGARLYQPNRDTWADVGMLVTDRYDHSATLLDSGYVALIGGTDTDTGRATNAIEVFDSIGFEDAGISLLQGRQGHSATLLRDGRVLVVGGHADGALVESVEIVDLEAGTSNSVAMLREARTLHSATLLPDGRVLVTGGWGRSGLPLDSGEVYDPRADRWDVVEGRMEYSRASHRAALLLNGRVAILAGSAVFSGSSPVSTGLVELYDPSENRFLKTDVELNQDHAGHGIARILDGAIALFGNDADGDDASDVDQYLDGRGHAGSWRPVIERVTHPSESQWPYPSTYFGPPKRIRVEGRRFTDSSDGSSGNTRNSAANIPIIELVRQDNGAIYSLAGDSWSDDHVEAPLPSDLPNGVYELYVTSNGIPSLVWSYTRQWPLLPVIIQQAETVEVGIGIGIGSASDG